MKIEIHLINGESIVTNGNIYQAHSEISKDHSNDGRFKWVQLGEATVQRGNVRYISEYFTDNSLQSIELDYIQRTEIK